MEFDADDEKGIESMVEGIISAGIFSGSVAVGADGDGGDSAVSESERNGALRKRLGDQLKEQATGMVRKRLCKKR